MRSEKIKRYLIMAMVGMLVLLAPLSYLRVLWAAGFLWQLDLENAFLGSHIFTDCDGTEIYNDGCLAEGVLENLLGNEEYIDNALYNRYKSQMKVGGLNPLVGRNSLKGTTFKTTLMPVAYQQQIRDLYGEHDGAVFAYNYKTGEVYIAMSLPSGIGKGVRKGSMSNSCLNGYYVPASTMKIITTICALEQNQDLAKFEFTCEKTYMLPDGNTINCHDYHGKLGLEDALGVSCNCYMAALIHQKMDEDAAKETLARLGILAEGVKPVEDELRGKMDALDYITGNTVLTSFDNFQSVWGMVGQGKTRANPVYMTLAAAAVANGGSAAQPYIMEGIYECGSKQVYKADATEQISFMDADTAKMVKMAWSLAVKDHYHNDEKPLSEKITLAKTGTAEEDMGINDRLLMGVMEEYTTAFYIVIVDSEDNNGLIFEAANLLAEAVGAM